MAMVKEMPVAAIAKLVGEYDKKIWRVVHHYVDAAVEAQDLSRMKELGIDDTSFRRGQSYVSVFADLDPSERRTVFVADGRGQEPVEQFAGFLGSRGGRAENIKEVCQDMAGPYLAGVREHLGQAQVTFDRFHVKQSSQRRSTPSVAPRPRSRRDCCATRGICGSSAPSTSPPRTPFPAPSLAPDCRAVAPGPVRSLLAVEDSCRLATVRR